MTGNFDLIIQWLQTHPQWAGFVTFLISALESMAIVGTLLPGSLLMIAIGALIGTGVLPTGSTLLWGIAGAITGDGLSYGMGYYFKDNIAYVWPFNRFPQWLSRGESFFNRHGEKSIFIGRFVGPVRAIIPVIAGMLGFPPRRFFTASILSGIAWALLYMAPGIVLGAAAAQLPAHVALRFVGIALLIILLVMILVWLAHRLYQLIEKQLKQFYAAKWEKLSHSYPHLTTLLKFHNPGISHGQLGNALLFLIFSLSFLSLTALVYVTQNHIDINYMINALFRNIRTPALDSIFLFITTFGEKRVALPACLIVFGFFALRKEWRTATHWLVLSILVAGSAYVFKELIHTLRPAGIILQKATFSFPSGHSVIAAGIYGFMAKLLVDRLPHYRRLIYSVAIIFIASILLSRLFVGAHWLTDVIGGVLLGLSCLLFVKISYHRYATIHINPWQTVGMFLLSLSLFAGFYLHKHFYEQLHNMQLAWPTASLDEKTWWTNQGTDAPLYRDNIVGKPSEPFTLQWMGNIDTIQTSLEKQGWMLATASNWNTVFHTAYVATKTPRKLLRKFDAQRPALVMLKTTSTQQALLLYLWNSHIILKPSEMPLWVGEVYYANHYVPAANEMSATAILHADLTSLKTQKIYYKNLHPKNNNDQDYYLLLIHSQ